LKSAGFQRDNVFIALTFGDDIKQELIQSYIDEMTKHPIVGELFEFASEIIVTSLPNLDNFKEGAIRSSFESNRDQHIETLITLLSKPVDPVPIFTHEKFQEAVERQAKMNTEEKMREHEKENEELKRELQEKNEKYTTVCDTIKNLMEMGKNAENERKVKEANVAKHELAEELRKLKQKRYVLDTNCIVS